MFKNLFSLVWVDFLFNLVSTVVISSRILVNMYIFQIFKYFFNTIYIWVTFLLNKVTLISLNIVCGFLTLFYFLVIIPAIHLILVVLSLLILRARYRRLDTYITLGKSKLKIVSFSGFDNEKKNFLII